MTNLTRPSRNQKDTRFSCQKNTKISRKGLRTETEIMQTWNPADKTLVSVACITYNHEKYIEDAIEGFLIQETDYPFETLIHSDFRGGR